MEALVTRISGVRNEWFPTPERPSPLLYLSHVMSHPAAGASAARPIAIADLQLPVRARAININFEK